MVFSDYGITFEVSVKVYGFYPLSLFIVSLFPIFCSLNL